MCGYPHFSFWIPITFDKIYFPPPPSNNLCKNTSELGGTVLKFRFIEIASVENDSSKQLLVFLSCGFL